MQMWRHLLVEMGTGRSSPQGVAVHWPEATFRASLQPAEHSPWCNPQFTQPRESGSRSVPQPDSIVWPWLALTRLEESAHISVCIILRFSFLASSLQAFSVLSFPNWLPGFVPTHLSVSLSESYGFVYRVGDKTQTRIWEERVGRGGLLGNVL